MADADLSDLVLLIIAFFLPPGMWSFKPAQPPGYLSICMLNIPVVLYYPSLCSVYGWLWGPGSRLQPAQFGES